MKKTFTAVLALATLTVPAANTWAAVSAAGTSHSHATAKPKAVKAKAKAKAKPKAKAKTVSTATKVFTGPSVDMRWGPVQVQLVVKGKKIIDIRATAPTERSRSAYINQQALPMLKSQVLKQQGINNVYAISGATMTSVAYGQSLQAALNSAHL